AERGRSRASRVPDENELAIRPLQHHAEAVDVRGGETVESDAHSCQRGAVARHRRKCDRVRVGAGVRVIQLGIRDWREYGDDKKCTKHFERSAAAHLELLVGGWTRTMLPQNRAHSTGNSSRTVVPAPRVLSTAIVPRPLSPRSLMVVGPSGGNSPRDFVAGSNPTPS